MKTLEINHKNGNTTVYKLIEDTGDLPIAYHNETPEDVILVLERIRKNRQRVKLHYGDIATGKDWNEENDVTGYISLSKGYQARFPILVFNDRSMGGSSVLDHRIVKIKSTSGDVLYQAENYEQPEISIIPSDMPEFSHNLIINDELYSRHKTLKSAELLKKKLS